MIELIARIVFSLAVVFGLMWGLARLARRPLAGRRGGAAMTVLTRQQVSRGSSIAVVRVVDRALVVGITDGQVTLLTETDLAAVELALTGPDERRAPVEVDDATAGAGTAPVRGPV
ncbi:MAG TPA: flagellar biosynthetic protein FliO, partial [Catenuloplanes sp.]